MSYFNNIKSKIEPNHVLIAMIILITFSINYIWEPFKVVDPANPKFEASEFKMRDYDTLDIARKKPLNRPKLRYALKLIFKPGDSKEFVDRVFIKSGRAEAEIYKTYPDKGVYDVRYVFGCGYLFKIYDQYCMGWVNSNIMVIMVRYNSETDGLIEMYPRSGYNYGIFDKSQEWEN